MTASKIIGQIKRLDRKEQLSVIRFAYQLDAERRLTGEELSGLAVRMVKATDPAEEALIREAMVRGFYNAAAGRIGSQPRNKRAIGRRRKTRSRRVV